MAHLYENLALEIEDQIRRGILRAGDRIPSVRKLSERKKLSVSTVLQAYLSLEGKGLVESRPQSGYYVRAMALAQTEEPMRTRGGSAAVRVGGSDFAREVMTIDRRPGVVGLAAAEVGPTLLPTKELSSAIHAASLEMKEGMHLYYRAPGHPELVREIARRHLSQGFPVDPDELVITIGATEALNIALRAVAKAGDSVFVESPTYYGVLQVLENMGVKAIELPVDARHGIDLAAFQERLKRGSAKALICIPDFQNPLGFRMPDEAKRELVKLAAKHDLPIIEDGVYRELAHDGELTPSLRHFDQKGNVIYVSSFSKMLSPGFRLGWVAGGKYAAQIQNLKFLNTLASPGLLQLATARYLRSGAFDRHLKRLRIALKSQMLVHANEAARSFPEGTRFTRPEGGYVLWGELPGNLDTNRLYHAALMPDASGPPVSFAPGALFSPSGKFKNALRLNCGAPFTPETARGLRKLGELAKRLGE